MNRHSTEVFVPPRHTALPELIAGLSSACTQLQIANEDCLRLQLLAEELFINTVTHAPAGTLTAAICIRIRREGTEIALDYEDEAPPFDPCLPSTSPRDENTVGGFGLHLIRGLSRELSYRREAGRNFIKLLL